MIQNILQLLNSMDAYNVSEAVEIAKGKHSIPRTVKDSYKQLIRKAKFKNKDGR